MVINTRHVVGAVVILVIAQVIAGLVIRHLTRTNSASVLAFAKPTCGCTGS